MLSKNQELVKRKVLLSINECLNYLKHGIVRNPVYTTDKDDLFPYDILLQDINNAVSCRRGGASFKIINQTRSNADCIIQIGIYTC